METKHRCHSCGLDVKANARRCPTCYVALEAATRAPAPLRAAPSATAVASVGATALAAVSTVTLPVPALPVPAPPATPLGIRCPSCETTVVPVAGWCPHCLDPLSSPGRPAISPAANPLSGWVRDDFEDLEVFGSDRGTEAPGAQIITGPWPERSHLVTHASWRQRVAATLIDGSVFVPALVMLALIPVLGLILLAAAAAFSVWQTCCRQGRTGQTIGKRRVGILLVDETTLAPIGARNATLRQLAHTVDAALLGLGYLWPLWDPRRQTFADQWLGTVVAAA